MHNSVVLTLVICLISQVLGDSDCNPIISTSKGDVKGSIIKSLLGKDIFSFRGIRYAKAPIGDLRFQPPVPVDSWSNVYDATKDGPVCPQPNFTPVSEDCLFLNVYTTKLPDKKHNPKRPVLVFIHAGGFYGVTGASYFVGPQYLLDRDVVLVTMNYRLASLGFISTGDKLAPGNNGLKDQVLSLKWVQENILAFGGDPDLVTIFGYSAGGTSVTAHMLSPMSKGLFHRALAMSGAMFAQWPIENHQLYLAQKQARLVGCPDDTTENIITCLKKVPAEQLGNSFFGFYEFGYNPVLLWTPVVELDFGQERFLTEHPITSALKGNFAKVPFMTGITTEEFSYSALNILQKPELLNEMNANFEEIAPITFIYERNTTKSKHVSKELKKQFLNDLPIEGPKSVGLEHLYADSNGGFGVNRGVKLIAMQNTDCTFYYKFTYQGRFSHIYVQNTTIPYGVVHHDDLIYIFYISKIFPKFNVTDPEYATVLKLTTILENFALTGKPIPKRCAHLDNVDWIPYTIQNNNYMDLGKTLKMSENLYEDRYSVWDKLFTLSDYRNKNYF
ncbi:hypothetical protein RN001_013636 [Aquatica leii]|uniref:Carboxylic ester hydrolase n=1 Tax=Aquatica leii TaxID=1421715 RepID=A0AAN7S751_9COLE|nr:hypothetical protein RN001_013636 [Aquatica leii]